MIDRLGQLPWIPDTLITVLTVHEDQVMPGHDPNVTAEKLRSRGAHVAIEHRQGKPTGTILEEIERLEPQLVVLGTRGLTGWKRVRFQRALSYQPPGARPGSPCCVGRATAGQGGAAPGHPWPYPNPTRLSPGNEHRQSPWSPAHHVPRSVGRCRTGHRVRATWAAHRRAPPRIASR